MKNILILFLALTCYSLSAQVFDERIRETFANGQFTRETLGTTQMLYKYAYYQKEDPNGYNYSVNKLKDNIAGNNPVYATTMFLDYVDPRLRADFAAVPGFNNMESKTTFRTEPGTTVYRGLTGPGIMVEYTSPQGASWLFVPAYKCPTKALQQAFIRDFLPENARVTGKQVARPGGIEQVVIVEPENKQKINLDQAVTEQVRTPPVVYQYNIWNPNNAPNASNDNYMPPPPPSSGYPVTPPPRPNIQVQATADQQQIETVIETYETIPGGIIITPKGNFTAPVHTVVYDEKRNLLMVNDQYRYETGLSPEEIATVWRAVYESADGRLGATSQDEFAGAPSDGMLAFCLSQADHFLGTIAYGYDANGCEAPSFQTVEGYMNPLDASLKDISSGHLPTIHDILQQELKDLQPRLFLNFQNVHFGFDQKTAACYPQSIAMKIQYQVFYTEDDRTYEFVTEAPERYFPHVVKAIKHFEQHYAAYEARNPFLLKIRLAAEVYGFFSALKNKNIKIGNSQALKNAFDYRKPITTILDNYNNIGDQSKLRQYWQQSLVALEKINPEKFSSALQKLAWYNFLLTQSLNIKDSDRIVKYRKTCLEMAKTVFPFRDTLKELGKDYQWFIQGVKFRKPMEVNAQTNFYLKYWNTAPLIAQSNFAKAMAFVNRQAQQENNYALFEWLYSYHPDSTLSHKYLLKKYDLMEKDIAAGDAYAQYMLGDAYYYGIYRPENQRIGADLLIKAAENGNATAQNQIGVIYFNTGRNDPGKVKTAIYWIRQAADQELPVALRNMGFIFEKGFIDGNPDMEQARYWYQKAINMGHVEAQQLITALD